MDKKRLQILQSAAKNPDKGSSELNQEFINIIREKLASRRYRADLSFITSAKDTTRTFGAEITFNASLGHPQEDDLIVLSADNFPTHQINWETVQVDPDEGTISFMLEPSVEVIPLKSVRDIPEEFKPIGTATYKRAQNSSGTINEIWELKKTDEGLALLRINNELDISAEDENSLKAGDPVYTDEGPGIIQSFDDLGNAFVQVGNKKKLVAAMDLKYYDINKDMPNLKGYYTQLYGPQFADALTKKLD